MKICMLTTDYLPNIGGVAAHIYNLSRALTIQGHKVVVINPIASKDTSIQRSDDHGFTVYRPGINPDNWMYRNKIIRKKLFSRAALKAYEQAKQEFGDFDIVHQQDYQDTTYAAAHIAKRSPWVWTCHTSRFMRDCNRRFKKKFIASSYRATSGIIAVSDEREQHAQAVFPHKPIVIIPNGVDTDAFSINHKIDRSAYNLSHNDLVVLCPSRMTEKKGVLFLAKAIPQIISETPDISWKFLFLGSTSSANTNSEYIETIKNLLAPFEKNKTVTYLGNLPLHKMPEINGLADIIVMPSLTEGMSLSALEAMSSQKAFVASDVGGMPMIVKNEKTGLLIPPASTEAIVDALTRLAKEPDLREQIALGARELVERSYSWQIIAERTVDFYQSLLNRKT